MRSVDALIAMLLVLTIVAVVIAQRSATAPTISGFFGAMAKAVDTIMGPVSK